MVREQTRSPKVSRKHGLRVYRLQVLNTMKGVLGLLPVLLLPASRRRVLGSQVNVLAIISARSQSEDERIGSDLESDSGVPGSDSESVRGRHGLR